jgi:hypothetical protein
VVALLGVVVSDDVTRPLVLALAIGAVVLLVYVVARLLGLL